MGITARTPAENIYTLRVFLAGANWLREFSGSFNVLVMRVSVCACVFVLGAFRMLRWIFDAGIF